jgi:hypothetical protein
VYIKAETRRKEKSIKNIATNFQEHLVLMSDFRRKLFEWLDPD